MMGMTFWRILFNPNAERVLGSMMAILGRMDWPLCIPDVKQVVETCHHEYLADFLIDILNDDLTTLCSGFFADSQEEAQARTADIFELSAVDDDGLVGIFQ